MEELSNIKKNSFFYLISTSSRLISNSIIFILIARNYGSDLYGSFTASHTISSLFLVLADFGFDILIVSEISRNPEKADKTLLKFLPLKFFFSLLAFVLLMGTTYFLPVNPLTKQITFIFGFSMVFTALTNNLFAFFRGIEKFSVEAKVSFITNMLILTTVVISSLYNLDLITITLIITLSRFMGLFLIIKEYSSFFTLREIRIEFGNLKNEFTKVAIFGLHMLFGTFYFQIDTILLVVLKGEAETGLYQAVFKLVIILLVIPELIVGTFFPTITRLFSFDEKRWISMVRFVFKILFLISLPFVMIIVLYSEEIIKLIYSRQEYIAAVQIFRMASIIIFLRFIAEPLAMLLTVTNRQLTRTIIVFCATIFSISINIFLIPLFGAKGAIYASIMVNAFTLFAYSFSIKEYFSNIIVDLKLWLTFGLMIIIGTVTFMIDIDLPVSIILLIFYFVFIFFFNFNKKERIALISIKNTRK